MNPDFFTLFVRIVSLLLTLAQVLQKQEIHCELIVEGSKGNVFRRVSKSVRVDAGLTEFKESYGLLIKKDPSRFTVIFRVRLHSLVSESTAGEAAIPLGSVLAADGSLAGGEPKVFLLPVSNDMGKLAVAFFSDQEGAPGGAVNGLLPAAAFGLAEEISAHSRRSLPKTVSSPTLVVDGTSDFVSMHFCCSRFRSRTRTS